MVPFPLVLMSRLNKTESAAFLDCMFSLFLKDMLFQIILRFLEINEKHTHTYIYIYIFRATFFLAKPIHRFAYLCLNNVRMY